MSVDDLPLGYWTPLLIGDQWPSSTSLTAVSSGSISRHKLSHQFDEHVELLLAIKGRHLRTQLGVTADDMRSEFKRGAAHSGQISEENATKSRAYLSAYNKVVELRHFLRNLAEEGNAAIDEVNKSRKPLPEKIAEILAIITKTKEDAFVEAAGCMGHVSDQIRTVLDSQGIETSPQSFAAAQGLGLTERARTNPEELKTEIGEKLDHLNTGDGSALAVSGTAGPALGDQGAQPLYSEPPTSSGVPFQTVLPDQGAQAAITHQGTVPGQGWLASNPADLETFSQSALPDQGAPTTLGTGLAAGTPAPSQTTLPHQGTPMSMDI